MSWIADRPVDYDADLVWDETAQTWIAADGKAGSRYQQQIVVVNDQGEIYYGAT